MSGITRQYARKVARKTPDVAVRAWVNAEKAATYYKGQYEAMSAVLAGVMSLKIDNVDMFTGEVTRIDLLDAVQWIPTHPMENDNED